MRTSRVTASEVENGVGAVDSQEKIVGGGVAVERADEVHVVGVNLLRWSGDVATVCRAEVADNAGVSFEHVRDAAVGHGVFSFVGTEAVDGVDGVMSAPVVFKRGEEGVVARVAEVVEERIVVVDGGDAGDGRTLVRRAVGDDEADSCSFSGVLEEHFFNENATE